MEVNNDILSFTPVTTEEAEGADLTETAAPSFATSMMLWGGGGGGTKPFLVGSDDLVDLRSNNLVLQRRVSKVAEEGCNR